MHIVVLRYGQIQSFPPVQNLLACLRALDHEVTLISYDIDSLPLELSNDVKVHSVALPARKGNIINRVKQDMTTRFFIRKWLKENKANIDVVWTTTDLAAREAGEILLGFRHIMQLSELVEYVPAWGRKPSPIHSNSVLKIAQNAWKVVVPEYNRAHIQKTWWDLPSTPIVLPNKPFSLSLPSTSSLAPDMLDVLSNEKKKILLYQGTISADRDLLPIAYSLEHLDNEFAFYIMGDCLDDVGKKMLDTVCSIGESVQYLGSLPAPYHLAATQFGYIGVLPYKPTAFWRYSSINALYCAPNKIWEYARCGLPMIGSDVPGLTTVFEQNGFGITFNSDEASTIAKAIRTVDKNYDAMSRQARCYYESISLPDIVESILS